MNMINRLLVFLFVCGVSCPPLWSEPCEAIVLKTMQYIIDSMDEFLGICPISCSVPLEPQLVVSEWGNETLLVCAPNKDIVGHCVEYNSGSKTIQEHVKCEPCTEFAIPCPFRYDSRESFKFRDCFTRCGGIKSSKDIYEKQQNTSQQLENAKKMLKDKDKETEGLKSNVTSLQNAQLDSHQQLEKKTREIEDLKADNAHLWKIVIVLSVMLAIVAVPGVALGLRYMYMYLTKLRKDKLHATEVEENEDEAAELNVPVTPRNTDVDRFIPHDTNEGNTEYGEINHTNNAGEAEVEVHDAVENDQKNISLNDIENSLGPVDEYDN